MRERAGSGGVALVAISAIAYGTVPIIATAAFALGIKIPTLLAWRFAIAASLLWIVALVRSTGTVWRGRVVGFIVLGLLYAAQSFAFFSALRLIGPAGVALILYTYPAIVTLVGAALRIDRLDVRKSAAILVAFVGTALIVRGAPVSLSTVGVALAIGSATIYSSYILIGSRLFARSEPTASAATVMTGTAAAFVVAAAVTGSMAIAGSPLQLTTIAGIAVVGTAIPVLCFIAGMPRVGPARASIISTLEPVVTVVLSWALLHQPLAPLQWAGAALVLAAVLVLEAGRVDLSAVPLQE